MEDTILDKTKIKEDLYEAVNGEWIEKATIPADKPATGGFQDLVDGIDDLLITDTMLLQPKKSQMKHFNTINCWRLT